jgi:hypothetical protein
MAFKMNGSPAKMGTISGTAGHSSALKMKAASALKQMELTKEDLKGSGARIKDKDQKSLKVSATGTTYGGEKGGKTKLDPSKKHHKAILETRWKKADKASGGTLNELVKQRKGLKKGTAEYAEVQNKINKALGSKKVHKVTATPEVKPTVTKTQTKKDKVITKGEDKKSKIAAKSAKKTAEVDENVSKKTAKISRKTAKKTSGKGSVEHLEAKKTHLEAKETDRQGKLGGKKQGIFRKWASKINKKRQKKVQDKIDAKKAEESPAKIYSKPKGKRTEY